MINKQKQRYKTTVVTEANAAQVTGSKQCFDGVVSIIVVSLSYISYDKQKKQQQFYKSTVVTEASVISITGRKPYSVGIVSIIVVRLRTCWTTKQCYKSTVVTEASIISVTGRKPCFGCVGSIFVDTISQLSYYKRQNSITRA